MFHRRPQSKPRRPFVADAPLLRAAFAADASAFEPHTYRAWLIAHGIDPDTGKMSPEGLAFFKQLLDADRAGKRPAEQST